MATVAAEHFGDTDTGVVALAVQQHDMARRHRGGHQYLFRAVHEVLIPSGYGAVVVATASTRAVPRQSDDDRIRLICRHIRHGRVTASLYGDAKKLQFSLPPVDRPVEPLPPGQAGPQRQRAPQMVTGLEQLDLMSPERATRAASRPAGPPPTTTTFDAWGAGRMSSSSQRRSR